MPNTLDLSSGGGPNQPRGLLQSFTIGDLTFGFGGGASLDTLSSNSIVGPQCSSISSTIPATTVQPSAASTYVVPWVQARPTDVIWVSPLLVSGQTSGISQGITAASWCTIAGQVEFRLTNSNVSIGGIGGTTAQSAQTWGFVRISMF